MPLSYNYSMPPPDNNIQSSSRVAPGIAIDDIVVDRDYGTTSEISDNTGTVRGAPCYLGCTEGLGFLNDFFFFPELNNNQNQRSHPNLVRLDELSSELTYIGNGKDVRDAEKCHNDVDGFHFERIILKIEEKQRVYDGDRSHPRLQVLDGLIWSFPGWQADVAEAENIHFDFDDDGFWRIMQRMQKRQQIHMDDKNRAFNVSQRIQPEKKRTKRGFWSRLKSMHHRKNRRYDDGRSMASSGMSTITDDYSSVLPKASPENLGSCVICGLETKSHMFIPCGHLCACRSCAQETIDRSGECPICRGKTVEAMKVFVP